MFSNHHEVFKYNESKRIILPLHIIIFFSAYAVWQIGIVFFSGTSLSLSGKTPIFINDNYTIFVIAAGYIFSAILIYLFPQKNILILRIGLIISIVATALMFLPLNSEIFTFFFYIQAFICVYMICGYVAIITSLFSIESELKRIPTSSLFLGIFGAIFHSDFVNFPYMLFNSVAIVCQVLALIALFSLPAYSKVCFLSRQAYADKTKNIIIKFTSPKILIFGFLFTGSFCGLLYCFCSTIVEEVYNGVSVMCASAILSGILFLILQKKFQINPAKIFSIFLSIFLLGFILAIISVNYPVLKYITCILFGVSLLTSDFYTYFGIFTFSKYPSPALAPALAIFALLAVIIHSTLLEAFRTNFVFLYSIYAVIAVVLVIVYLFIEPYFSRALKDVTDIKYISSGTPKKPSCFELLSEQESILANHILDGYTESAISKMMNITLNTQKSYRKNLYSKLQIHSKRELFLLAKNSPHI